jgi:hypothetical protein
VWSEKQMSSKNNVNPGQYKVAGRERLGENIGQERDRQRMARSRQSFEQPPNRKESPDVLARTVQPRDTAEPRRARKKAAEKRGPQAARKPATTRPARRASTRPAKRASKRSVQLSGRSRKKTSRKAS